VLEFRPVVDESDGARLVKLSWRSTAKKVHLILKMCVSGSFNAAKVIRGTAREGGAK